MFDFCRSYNQTHRMCIQLSCTDLLWQWTQSPECAPKYSDVKQVKTHHKSWTSNTLQSVVHSSVGHLLQDFLNRLVIFSGVDAISGSELPGFLKLLCVDVDPDDLICHSSLAAHDGSQSDRSKPKHGTWGIFFNLIEHTSVNQKSFVDSSWWFCLENFPMITYAMNWYSKKNK